MTRILTQEQAPIVLEAYKSGEYVIGATCEFEFIEDHYLDENGNYVSSKQMTEVDVAIENDLCYYAILFQLEEASIPWSELEPYQRNLGTEVALMDFKFPYIGKGSLDCWQDHLVVVTSAPLHSITDVGSDIETHTNETAAEALTELCLAYHQHNQNTSIL